MCVRACCLSVPGAKCEIYFTSGMMVKCVGVMVMCGRFWL